MKLNNDDLHDFFYSFEFIPQHNISKRLCATISVPTFSLSFSWLLYHVHFTFDTIFYCDELTVDKRKKSRSLRKNTRLLKRQTWQGIHHQSDLTRSTLNWTASLSSLYALSSEHAHILLPPLNIFNLYESCMFSN